MNKSLENNKSYIWIKKNKDLINFICHCFISIFFIALAMLYGAKTGYTINGYEVYDESIIQVANNISIFVLVVYLISFIFNILFYFVTNKKDLKKIIKNKKMIFNLLSLILMLSILIAWLVVYLLNVKLFFTITLIQIIYSFFLFFILMKMNFHKSLLFPRKKAPK